MELRWMSTSFLKGWSTNELSWSILLAHARQIVLPTMQLMESDGARCYYTVCEAISIVPIGGVPCLYLFDAKLFTTVPWQR